MDSRYRYEARKGELWQALQTRIVTDEEMEEILAYGDSINVQPMVPYKENEKARARGDAFVTQQRLRFAAQGQ